MKKNELKTYDELTNSQRKVLHEADARGKVEALVNNKWYLKTNMTFAHNGIYRITGGLTG